MAEVPWGYAIDGSDADGQRGMASTLLIAAGFCIDRDEPWRAMEWSGLCEIRPPPVRKVAVCIPTCSGHEMLPHLICLSGVRFISAQQSCSCPYDLSLVSSVVNLGQLFC